jgi:hypothetical protein
MFLVHLQLTFDKQQKNEICFVVLPLQKPELKKIKNIVIAEYLQDVIVEVIGKYRNHQLKFKYMIKNDLF